MSEFDFKTEIVVPFEKFLNELEVNNILTCLNPIFEKTSYTYADGFRKAKIITSIDCIAPIILNAQEAIEKSLGEEVLYTYTYIVRYYKDSFLIKHDDKESAEITFSINLDGDERWPFYIEEPDDVENKIVMQPGDAIAYWGYHNKHRRDTYSGNHYTQLLISFVRANGPLKYFEGNIGLNQIRDLYGEEIYTNLLPMIKKLNF